MARTNRTAPEAILSVLRRGPKRGLTATAISERAGTVVSTTRTTLGSLVIAGQVEIVGTVRSETRGRPANLYAFAA